MARDVAVVNGIATGSNTRTVYSNSDLYNTPISWSSTSTTNAIAFVTRPAGTYSANTIMRVSASGGSASVLYQSPSGYSGIYRCPTWSNDDSRIAFIDHPGPATSGIVDTLRVIDASTGALLASNALPTTTASVLEWSRSGLDTLVLGLSDKSRLYYVGPMTGVTSTDNVAGGNPTWSPNNSAVASSTTAGAWQKTAAFSTSSSTVVSGAAADGVWKK
jgi:hypothetical protein